MIKLYAHLFNFCKFFFFNFCWNISKRETFVRKNLLKNDKKYNSSYIKMVFCLILFCSFMKTRKRALDQFWKANAILSFKGIRIFSKNIKD